VRERLVPTTQPDKGDTRLTLLERVSREAGEQLSLAMEALGDGFVLFDRDDRLVLCNQSFLEIFPILAPTMVPGTPFEDIVRYGLERGQFAAAIGSEEAYLAKRLAEHRSPYSCTEQELADGRWVQIIEQATPDGGRIGLRIEITERKRQQAAALDAKRQLEATLKAVPDLMFEVDPKGRFLACHVADPTRLLLPPAELLGKTITETLPADAARICHAAIDEALSTGISTGRQYRLEGFDGSEWFELSVARKDADGDSSTNRGEPTLIVLVRDITERKRLEQNLAAERDFLDQIMATSLSAIVVIDASGQLVFTNKAAERALRLDATTGSGRCFDDPALRITTFDGKPYPMEQLPCTAVLRTGQPVHDVRFAIEWPDGRCSMLSVNATPLAAASEAPRGVVCSITDITEQMQAETDLRNQELLLRGLFELSSVGIALTDFQTGRFIDANDAVLQQLGYARDELLQLTYFDITPEEYYPRDRRYDQMLALNGVFGPNEKENIRKDGSRFPVLLTSTIVTDRSGRQLLWSIVEDITERKRLEQSLAAERDFLDQIMATSLSAIVAIDASGQLVFANQAAERILGVTAATATDRHFDDPAWRVTDIDGGPYPVEEIPFVKVMTTGKPVFDVRHAIEWPDGTRRILSVNAAPLAHSPGSTSRVVCSVTDITDQLAAETALRQNEALLRGLFELCPMGIALTDLETGAFLDVNEAVLRQLGYSRDELLQLTYLDITPEQYQARDRNNQVSLVKGGRYTPHEKENIRKDGSRFPVLLNTTVVTDQSGRKLLWSIVEDITERKANEAQILRQAHYDELTGLPNRRLFQERLEQALERARRGRHIGAVAMLDLDHFKTINDSLGHKAGDQVLIEAANRLRSCTRATDTVARFGGDEFLLLLDDISSPADAEAIVGKIHTILARPFAVDGEKMQLGVSIGVCIFDAEHNDPDTLLRNADKAMYASKSAGRNQTRFFTTVAAMPDHHHPAHRGPAIDRRSPRGQ